MRNGANRGHQLDGMDLKFTPCIDRRLLDTVERSGPILATFQAHFLAESLVVCILAPFHLIPRPTARPPPIPPHPPSSAHSEISAHQKKPAQNAKNQALTNFKCFLYELLGIVDYIGGEEMIAN